MGIDISARLLKRRRTKILVTLGPATASREAIDALIAAGTNVFRLNMSHGTHEGHRALFGEVRAAARAAGEPVAVLGDLRGPKVRVGTFRDGGVELVQGEQVRVVIGDVPGESGVIPVPWLPAERPLRPGDRLLLADGAVELAVERAAGDEILCRVVASGRVGDRQGLNLPDLELACPSFTDKDRDDARMLIELGVDYLALSFVRNADDVRRLRAFIAECGGRQRIIAKIERPQALHNIDGILDTSDAIMVARGDLGVEMPAEAVPVAQDELVERGRRRHRPTIIATQMLESMVHHTRPTRAEVSDVAHAVRTGADAVMLSAETAVGEHPVAAVATMDRVIRRAEAHLWEESGFSSLSLADVTSGLHETGDDVPVNEAVAGAVWHLSRRLGARAILVLSRSGTSSMVISSVRPSAPLLAATASPEVSRWMSLFWGVVPVCVEATAMDDPVVLFADVTARLGLVEPGDRGLVVRGFSEDPATTEPSITVVRGRSPGSGQ